MARLAVSLLRRDMKTVLHLNSSARTERSHTRYLTKLFVKEWRSLRPDDLLISRDVGTEPPPPVNEVWIAAAFTPPQNRTSAMREVLRLSELLVDELIRADLIVLGAPMYRKWPTECRQSNRRVLDLSSTLDQSDRFYG
jgi:FMN-dependent NADH-azoreductase